MGEEQNQAGQNFPGDHGSQSGLPAWGRCSMHSYTSSGDTSVNVLSDTSLELLGEATLSVFSQVLSPELPGEAPMT